MKLKTLTLESNVTEQEIIESLLNMRYSNVKEEHILLLLSLHAMSNRWHINKLNYYLKLLEIK